MFSVWLPGADALPERAAVASSNGTPPNAAQTQTTRRLLYIEDNAVNALVVQELVKRRPHLSLSCAADGQSGINMAKSLQPDLVLVDMQLPDMDGFEVLRQLRACKECAQIPAIALSANAMPEDITRALQMGFSDYWTKPIDFKAFLAGLDNLFNAS